MSTLANPHTAALLALNRELSGTLGWKEGIDRDIKETTERLEELRALRGTALAQAESLRSTISTLTGIPIDRIAITKPTEKSTQ